MAETNTDALRQAKEAVCDLVWPLLEATGQDPRPADERLHVLLDTLVTIAQRMQDGCERH